MPQTITLLKVFIASPSDVLEERQIAKKIIDELNITFGNHNNIKLELIGWETHTYPNVGIDAQDVINKQIGNDYDIFLGIMWNKFGSPTSKADSGTEEEFEGAYNKHLVDQNSIELLFYFKDTAINLSSINIEQLIKVNSFKEKLKLKGVYYKQFTESDEFANLIRFAFTSILQNYSSKESQKKSNSIKSVLSDEVINLEAEEILEDIDEIGFLESLELSTFSMQESQKSIVRMTKYINDLGNNLGIQTKKINEASTKPIHLRGGILKKLVDQTANILTIFNDRIRIEIPINSEHFSNGIRYYNISILTFSEFTTQDNKILADIISLKESLIYASSTMTDMRESIKSVPVFTTKFGKAKKESIKIMSEIIDEFQTHINLVEQLEINIDGISNVSA
jgi:hypothetical protein